MITLNLHASFLCPVEDVVETDKTYLSLPLQEHRPQLLAGRLGGSSVGSIVSVAVACDVAMEVRVVMEVRGGQSLSTGHVVHKREWNVDLGTRGGRMSY